MSERDIVTETFINHSNVLNETLEKHAENIVRAADLITNCFKSGGKLVIFGNGGSAADSQHMAGEFIGRFLRERKSLPAIALTTDSSILTALGNDYGFDKVFERQIESLANTPDIVIAISTSGNSENVVKAVAAAKKRGLVVISLTGEGGGMLKGFSDILIDVSSIETPRVQETHILVEHIVCDLVENNLF